MKADFIIKIQMNKCLNSFGITIEFQRGSDHGTQESKDRKNHKNNCSIITEKKAKLTKTDDANCSDINSSNTKSCNESSENNLVGRPNMEMNSDTNHDRASELLLQSKAQNGLGASNISNSVSQSADFRSVQHTSKDSRADFSDSGCNTRVNLSDPLLSSDVYSSTDSGEYSSSSTDSSFDGSYVSDTESESDSESESASVSSVSTEVLSDDDRGTAKDDLEKNNNLPVFRSQKEELYPGGSITLMLASVLIITFVYKHNLSKSAWGDLLKLISAIIPNCKNTIKSVHTMKSFIASLFNSTDAVEKKYFSRCLSPVENNRCMRFTKCRTAKVNRFMYLHPEETLRKLFSDSNFLKLLSKGKRQSCQQNSEIFDVYDGLKYKELMTQSGFLRNKYNISFTLNTYGVNKYRSSKSGNIWPVYLIINELPKEYRFKIEYMIPAMVYCDRDKPHMLTFLKPLINKMNDWYMNGIDVKDTPEGDIHFHAMLFITTADLQARADLMNMKHYNGQFSCHLCKDEGMGIGNGLHRVWPYNDNNELRSDEEQHQYIKQGTQKRHVWE